MAFYTQKITGNTKTEITSPYNVYDSMIFTNTDASANVTIDLYITEQNGTKLRQAAGYEYDASPTEVNLAAGYAVTTDSLTIAVSTEDATNDIFLNEKVWLSNGTLVGTCTAVGSTTAMTFGDGIVNALANDDDLYTGARFYLLKNVVIPAGASLKLGADDIFFDTNAYNLYIISGDADGQIDIILRYNTKRR